MQYNGPAPASRLAGAGFVPAEDTEPVNYLARSLQVTVNLVRLDRYNDRNSYTQSLYLDEK